MLTIEQLRVQQIPVLVEMMMQLWPEQTKLGLASEIQGNFTDPDWLMLLAIENGEVKGFAEFSIRHDEVEGATTDKTGYLESIYVQSASRQQHVAKKLVTVGEKWLVEQEVTEIASDVDESNLISQQFHEGTGFAEVARLVHYIKVLDV